MHPHRCRFVIAAWLAAGILASAAWTSSALPQATGSQEKSGKKEPEQSPEAARLARGKKLILKDGSFQLVRSYERNGDRVRYYSLERAAWEELPAAMVDWDATARDEAKQTSEAEALAKRIHVQEQEQNAEIALDIDASLQVAPGVFLPPGEGLFVVEGRSVTPLEQVGTQLKADKKQLLKQVLIPIPVVPGKQNLVIPGARAKIRITTSQPEFYLREAPPDPEHASPIQKSSRPGESGPEVQLVRVKVKGDKRQVGSISTFFGDQVEEKRNTISIERWDIAQNVFRFTLSQPLASGEYVLAEVLPEGMNLYVWDFGIDPARPKASSSAEATKNQPH